MKLQNLMTIALLALVLSLTAVSSSHAQQRRTTLESLTEISEAVVVARTVKTESFWNDDRTAILTRVTLEVSDFLTGQTPVRTEVIIPGGRIGDYIHEVSDMPSFTQDEEAVVFLERHRTGIHVVAGGLMGKLPITQDRTTGVKSVSGSGLILMESDLNSDESNDARAAEDLDAVIILDVFKRRFKERIK